MPPPPASPQLKKQLNRQKADNTNAKTIAKRILTPAFPEHARESIAPETIPAMGLPANTHSEVKLGHLNNAISKVDIAGPSSTAKKTSHLIFTGSKSRLPKGALGAVMSFPQNGHQFAE